MGMVFGQRSVHKKKQTLLETKLMAQDHKLLKSDMVDHIECELCNVSL
jgi:hypothetical protein